MRDTVTQLRRSGNGLCYCIAASPSLALQAALSSSLCCNRQARTSSGAAFTGDVVALTAFKGDVVAALADGEVEVLSPEGDHLALGSGVAERRVVRHAEVLPPKPDERAHR